MKAVILSPYTIRLILEMAGTPSPIESIESVDEHDYWDTDERPIQPHEHYAVVYIDDEGVTGDIDWSYHTADEARTYAPHTE